MARNTGVYMAESVVRVLRYVGPTTVDEVAKGIERDPLMVYRCLLRLKKKGIVTSEPDPRARFRHLWRLV